MAESFNQNDSNTQRTIQVKIGNQAAKSLTPDEAADYLKTIASQGWMSSGANSANSSEPTISLSTENDTSSHEVHMTFGGPAAAGGVSVSAVAAAAASSVIPVIPPVNTTNTTNNNNNAPLPCTEKEMKALMSMFVEIMGLQMNTDRLNGHELFSFPSNVPPPPGGWPADVVWPPADDNSTVPPLAASTGSTTTSSSATEQPGLEGLPGLEDIPSRYEEVAVLQRWPVVKQDGTTTDDDDETTTTITGRPGITPFEWEALERVAVEEALEHEERARKLSPSSALANNNKTAVNATKDKQLEQLELQRQQEERKRQLEEQLARQELLQKETRKKALLLWRSQVLITFQGEQAADKCPELEELLQMAPLWEDEDDDDDDENNKMDKNKNYYTQVLEILQPELHLLPLLFPKQQRHGRKLLTTLTRTPPARLLLALFLGNLHLPLLVEPMAKTGRSVLHTAAWYGDAPLVQLICTQLANQPMASTTTASNNSTSGSSKRKKKKKRAAVPRHLDATCQESGWTPLHYAAVSGSLGVVEVLLAKGCHVLTGTNSTFSWSQSTGRSLKASELVQWIRAGKHETAVETVGMALRQVQKEFLSSSSSANHHYDPGYYLLCLERVAQRLKEVESHGYFAKSPEQVHADVQALEKSWQEANKKETESAAKTSVASAAPKSKRNRKKNKKKKNDASVGSTGSPTGNASTTTSSADESGANQKTDGNEPSKTSSNPPKQAPSTKQSRPEDPLVTALLGMGFTNQQIQSGIQACGGHSRATADDVVAWIFGHDGGGNDATSESAAMTPKEDDNKQWTIAESTTSSKKPSDVSLATSSQAREEEERKKEVALQAKREERRRRNREWNKRQEAKAAVVAPAVPPKDTNRPAVARPLTLDSFPPPPRAPTSNKQQPPRYPVEPSWQQNEDASTTGDLIEHGTIELIQDDATISTMGSFRTVPSVAVPPPVAAAPPAVVPPGFAPPSQLQPPPVTAPPPTTTAPMPWNDPVLNSNDYRMPLSTGFDGHSLLPPLSMQQQQHQQQQHQPQQQHRHNPQPPQHHSQLTGHFSLETTGFPGPPPPTSLLGVPSLNGSDGLGGLFPTSTPANAPSLDHGGSFHGSQQQQQQHPGSFPFPGMGSGAPIPDGSSSHALPGFLGTTTPSTTATALDASILDSLTMGLGGMWGENSGGSSSLLDRHPPASTTRPQYTAFGNNNNNDTDWNEESSRQQQQQQHSTTTWQPPRTNNSSSHGGGTGGGSIW